MQKAFAAAARAKTTAKPSPLRQIARGAAAVLLAGTALSTILQFAPGLVATPTGDYLATKGYSSSLRDQFAASNSYIYDRGNPLVPFHMAGHAVRRLWTSDESLLAKTFGAPFLLHDGFSDGLGLLRSDSKLAAYSYSTYQDDPQARSVMVWPSDDTLTTAQWLHEMTGLKVAKLDFRRHSEADMQRILIETGLLHELRHGDQSKSDTQTLKESDADAFSLHAAAAGGAAPSLVGEARIFLMAARTVSAVLSGDSGHATALALRRGMENDFTRTDALHAFSLQHRAYEDGSAFTSAHNMLRGVVFDSDIIPASMDRYSAYYHAASALLDAGIAQRDNENDAIALYVQAMDYLDAISGGTLIDRSVDHRNIDVSSYRARAEAGMPDVQDTPPPRRAPAQSAAPKPVA